ncbi:hypothetical protein RO3G_16272 [Rhizopus delemar RA 99-880]|uniref:Uncharacterized protein n=1 Tax=Rhizopus delemar (strain RA 99-880 / ATCC MYA-4621 / FGSC 9543 / NRRL 43880) TaxID=246409 RepID=I1CSY1_RHIO9|nr:hypothetical protein RO3G_16272 [Rhizopus delemar RA 99-880]|eukprot:EIE91561.1 hypothetical protein RO3G_16272 [Rhizopus delemar RA 99-880]
MSLIESYGPYTALVLSMRKIFYIKLSFVYNIQQMLNVYELCSNIYTREEFPSTIVEAEDECLLL